MPVTFTFDLEDSRSDLRRPERFPHVTRRVLGFLREQGITGTFFIVGELAETHADLVAEVAQDGHEIALHGYRHVPLVKLDAAAFREDLLRGRDVLERATGTTVRGYRAPIFSLVPSTAWAVDVLSDLGFTYSSSLLPAANPLNGWPGAPRSPFRWDTGLVELPSPVAGFGRLLVPYLGGVYLRYLPMPIVERLARSQRSDAVTADWLYCHPYDFDTEEPFERLPEASYLTSRILHARRGATYDRVARVLRAGGVAGPPLGALVDETLRADRLPVVHVRS